MRNRVPAFLLALTLAGTLGLAGCGGDDEGDDTSGPSDESTSATTESEPEETEATEAEPEATSEPAEPAEPEEGDGDKPSREDVIAGYEGIITAGQSGLPSDIVTQTATCFTDEIYDDASAETLQAIADENAGGINPDDASLFGDAATACAAG